MSIQAAEKIQFSFVSDGVATAFVFDLTQPPNRLSFAGKLPSGVRAPVVSNTQAVANPTATATLAGSTVTVTFATPPPQLDGNSLAVTYTLQLQLVY
jgi:hypothetical protein